MQPYEPSYTTVPKSEPGLFSPYIVLEDSDKHIHLTVSKARRMLFTFGFIIMPFVIVCLMPGIFIFNDGGIPWAALLMMAASALVVVVMLLMRRLIHEVTLSRKSFEITSSVLFKKSTRIVHIADAEHLYLKVTYGRGGGAVFWLQMKDGKKVEFMVIPGLQMTRKKTKAISERLKELTGLSMDGNFFGRSILDNADL